MTPAAKPRRSSRSRGPQSKHKTVARPRESCVPRGARSGEHFLRFAGEFQELRGRERPAAAEKRLSELWFLGNYQELRGCERPAGEAGHTDGTLK